MIKFFMMRLQTRYSITAARLFATPRSLYHLPSERPSRGSFRQVQGDFVCTVALISGTEALILRATVKVALAKQQTREQERVPRR